MKNINSLQKIPVDKWITCSYNIKWPKYKVHISRRIAYHVTAHARRTIVKIDNKVFSLRT